MLSTPSPNSYSPKSPTHPLKPLPSPTPLPRISLRFLPIVIWKKGKTKKVQGLGAQPKGLHALGHRRAGASASPARARATSWALCKCREGQEPAQDPGGAASQDLAEPRAASFNLATADEHRRRKRKHCQVIREKYLNPSLYSMTLLYLTILRLPSISLNPIHRKLLKEREWMNLSLIHKTKCSLPF